ncbi:MAG TPA: peptidylprolyl isomerase [Sphingomicrobium sp.]|nr:peptidylprolyl isomerase [Sphingomicrobium sp.]
MHALFLSLALLQASAAPAPKPLTPADVVAAAPASDWRAIPAEDLLLVDLKGRGQVVIQLAPQFAPVHVANIRAFARSDYWDGAAVYRVQDNYVAQWGIGKAEKPMPAGVVKLPPHEYWRSSKGLPIRPLGYRDSYAPAAGYARGWPVAHNPKTGRVNLTHCYGSVGVARDLAPDTGSGGELYAIIGHAPRQLDRNIAVAGRVVEGIEHLSSLKRGTEALGFYKERSDDAPIERVRLASDLPAADQPRFEYLDPASASFATYLRLRANRSDAFYKVPAGGVDLCNAPVPVRRKPA